MSLPWTNAKLTSIKAVGTSGDYDSAGSAGSSRWTGSEDVTVIHRLVEAITPGRVDEVEQTHMEIRYSVGQLVQRGDALTYTMDGEQHVRTAGSLVQARLVGRVRVVLQDA